jgi:hypothetical protein
VTAVGSMHPPVGLPPAMTELLTRVDALSDEQLKRIGMEWLRAPVDGAAIQSVKSWFNASAVRLDWAKRAAAWCHALVTSRFENDPEWRQGSPILAISVGVQAGTLAAAASVSGDLEQTALAEAMRPLHRGLAVKE